MSMPVILVVNIAAAMILTGILVAVMLIPLRLAHPSRASRPRRRSGLVWEERPAPVAQSLGRLGRAPLRRPIQDRS